MLIERETEREIREKFRKRTGKTIQLFRILFGHRQEDFSYILNTSQKNIAAIEAGFFNPNYDILKNLCTILRLNEQYIMNNVGDVFSQPIIYLSPLRRDMTNKTLNVINKTLKDLFLPFLKKEISEWYEITGVFSNHYVFKIQPSFVFFNAGHLVSTVKNFGNQININFSTTNIKEVSEKIKNKPLDIQVIYSFLLALKPDNIEISDAIKNYETEKDTTNNLIKNSILNGLLLNICNVIEKYDMCLTDVTRYLKDFKNCPEKRHSGFN